MAIKAGVTVTKNGVPALKSAIRALTSNEVLVGIPSEKTKRDPEPTGKIITVKGQQGRKDIVIEQMATPDITNAELGYIHEFGVPERNIPARAFLMPGIRNGRSRYATHLRNAAKAALEGKADQVMVHLNRVGIEAQNAVKAKLTNGPFQPLSERTIRGRQTRSGSRKNMDTTPLLDTGQLNNAITYVIRKLKRNKQNGTS